jgi:site-specific DNA-methyltransferase (adenine-specific)
MINLPALSPEEYAALRDDIAKRGILVPIEVDADTGEVIDGNHRMRACAELGIDPPRVLRHFATEQERNEHAIVLNLLRRQMGPITWAQVFTELCKVRGARLGEGAGRPHADDNCATVAQIAEELGVPKRTAYRRLALADDLAEHPDLAARVDKGDMPAKQAIRQVRDERRQEERREVAEAARRIPEDTRWRVEVGNIATYHTSELCDFIITDPPYPREYLDLYSTLARRAHEFVKPGGLVVVMCGQSYLDEIYHRMGEYLSYYWTACYLTPGQPTPLRTRQVNTSWKPILVYALGGAYSGKTFGDVFKSDLNDKTFHEWGQSVSGMLSLIQQICQSGQSIFDPFCGGGATGVAAIRHGCLFRGIDIDEQNVLITRARLADDTAAE